MCQRPMLGLVRRRLDARLRGFAPSSLVLGTALLVVLSMHMCRSRTRSSVRALLRWIRAHGLKKALAYVVFCIVRRIPAARRRIAQQQSETCKQLQADVVKETADEPRTLVLPARGVAKDTLLSTLKRWSENELKHWSAGQASGAVYHGGKELSHTLGQVYAMFSLSNPMHPDLFPYCRKMEAEIVHMLVALFHGNEQCCGTVSSGGTESILLACKAYRDRARDLRGIEHGEIVAPVSIHAAFEKAAHYFGMRMVHVPIDPNTMQCRLADVRAAVTGNTVLIAASAPCFPYGVIDPIPELSAFAASLDIGFHSDCCLGGMLAPFVEKLGHQLPAYDFRNAGVSSISVDTHKYGYSPKGSSSVLYSSHELRHYQYFCSPEWTGGIYASPTLAGSRPGAVFACTWAALVSMGEDGYISAAEQIMAAASTISEGITSIDGIHVMGQPQLSVVAFASDDEQELSTYKVGEAMSKKGWNLNTLQYPSAIHICCTFLHRGQVAERFVNELRLAVAEVRENSEKFATGNAAIYGMAHGVPDSSLIKPLAYSYVDALFLP